MGAAAVAYVVTAMGVVGFAIWTVAAVAEMRRRTRLIRAEVHDALTFDCHRCGEPAYIVDIDLTVRFGRRMTLRATTDCPRCDG